MVTGTVDFRLPVSQGILAAGAYSKRLHFIMDRRQRVGLG